MIRPAIKFVHTTSLILIFAIEGLWISVTTFDSLRLRSKRSRLISKYSRLILSALDFQVIHQGAQPTRGSLVIANHLSYLDILTIGALWPCVFVTSIEMRDSPGLGQLCRLGGCIFVERRRQFVSRSELKEVEEALRAGFTVVVFPEATTSDGSELLPFKRALMRPAQRAGATVFPLCINYLQREFQGRRDFIPYHGEMHFLGHFLKLMTAGKLLLELRGLPPLELKPESTLKPDIAMARSNIGRHYIPIYDQTDAYPELSFA